MGGAFVGFSDFSKKQKLTAAGENLKNILRDVQSRVSSGEMDCSVCDCSASGGTVEGWWADFSQQEYYGQCQGTEYFRTSFKLSPDIVLTPLIDPPFRMHFRPSPGGVENAGTVCVSSPDLSGTYYRVRVESSGNITDSGQLDPGCTP